MTDLEITRLCAEAMGMKPSPGKSIPQGILCMYKSWYHKYDPLNDDAQAMALVKKFHLHLSIWDELDGHEAGWWRVDAQDGSITCRHADLNRAICECVAKLKQGEG